MPYKDSENQKQAQRDHYLKYKDGYIARTKDRCLRNKTYIDGYKSVWGCTDCGENDPIVLDFDHKDGVKKLFNIGNSRSISLARLQAEIEKCEVRCANCHRRKTVERRNKV